MSISSVAWEKKIDAIERELGRLSREYQRKELEDLGARVQELERWIDTIPDVLQGLRDNAFGMARLDTRVTRVEEAFPRLHQILLIIIAQNTALKGSVDRLSQRVALLEHAGKGK